MTNSKLSLATLKKIWSALHFTNEPNHSGQAILTLIKSNHKSAYLGELLNNLEQHKEWNSSFLIELENLFMDKPNLKTQIEDIIENSSGESVQALPKEAALEIPANYRIGTDYSPSKLELLGGIFKIFGRF